MYTLTELIPIWFILVKYYSCFRPENGEAINSGPGDPRIRGPGTQGSGDPRTRGSEDRGPRDRGLEDPVPRNPKPMTFTVLSQFIVNQSLAEVSFS